MQSAARQQQSPALGLDVKQLVRCIEGGQGMTLQKIADSVRVVESTVQRWKVGDIRKLKRHNHDALVSLHDRKVCGHSRFVYICDHPYLESTTAHGYDDPPLTDLLPLDKLKIICGSFEPSPWLEPAGAYKHIITAAVDLPPHLRSRCYQWVRKGVPVYLVLYRPGDEAAIPREISDHIVQPANRRQPHLPVYVDASATALVGSAAHGPKQKPQRN